MVSLDFAEFNILEGSFWIVLSIAVLIMSNYIHEPRKQFWYLASVTLILFGVSDFFEVYMQRSFFEQGLEWLLVWKIICVFIIVILFVFYIRCRLKS